MQPKKKAKELIDKYSEVFITIGTESKGYLIKECALICVDEIIHNRKPIVIKNKLYWEEVKKEIENYKD